jgi:hypothetical protein
MKVWEYKSNTKDNLSALVNDKGKDIVMTNKEMAKYLINECTHLTHGDIVIEPCKGSGSFYENLPIYVNKLYCEINEGIDYLDFSGKVDITLSNPPFVPRRLFWSFMEKAMETTKKNIYWLLNMSSLNVFTPKRLDEMKDKRWFIQQFHIVADKRWFGRYVWVKIGREDTGFISWTRRVF